MRNWSAVGLGFLALQVFCSASAAQDLPAPANVAPDTVQQISPQPSNQDTNATSAGLEKVSPTSATPSTPPCPKGIRCVIVADPYLEMHTGPGVGYPVFHVVGRGETIEVQAKRTDWFYVRTTREIEGWVSLQQMTATLEIDGKPTEIHVPTRADFTARRWEAGLFVGRFKTASLLAVFGTYGMSEHLSAELTLGNAGSNIANSFVGSLGLNHIFAPEWPVSPYVGLGTGIIYTQPRSTLVQPEDTTDQIGYVTGGVRGYLTRRFLARFEYRGNVVFTSSNDNEEIHEWKLGFAFFF